jgi:DNA-binding NtrC family response regulator
MLKVPALCDRDGDLGPLVDGLLQRINEQSERSKEPGFSRKTLSSGARKLLMREVWPGNIRQLENTLRRAIVWAEGEVVSPEDIKEALLPAPSTKAAVESILDQPIDQGVDIQSIIGTVASHYLRRAIEAAHGNKSKAAELVGLGSYQTLTNWMQKYGVKANWH